MHAKQIIISESVTLGDTIRKRKDQIETKKMGKMAVSVLHPGKDLAIWIEFRDPICFLKRIFNFA